MAGIRHVVCVLGIALVSTAASGQLDASTAAAPHHDLGSCGVILRSDSPCVLVDAVNPRLGAPAESGLADVGKVHSYHGPESVHRSILQRSLSDEKVVVPEGTRVALLLSGELSGKQSRERRIFTGRLTRQESKHSPSLIAVQDVVVKGVKVIAGGTAAQFMPFGDNPGLMNMPGSVGFEVMGITSVHGEVVPLYASQSARGAPPCVERDCVLLPLLFWLHGDPGKIDAGLLFNATVTEDVELNGTTLPSSSVATAKRSLARLHLYEVIQPQAGGVGFENSDWPSYSTVLHLDGKRTGRMEAFQYACIAATPGKHWLRVGHEEYILDVEAGQELYIRITASTRTVGKLVDSTLGYEFGDTPLSPARLRATAAMACFAPLSETAKTHVPN